MHGGKAANPHRMGSAAPAARLWRGGGTRQASCSYHNLAFGLAFGPLGRSDSVITMLVGLAVLAVIFWELSDSTALLHILAI